ncbi:ArsA family ATPase [Dermatobacter hominis]|uniref:ArsA family ATPase n=1 Tax=Dermatobacter hominis TaxID=2884263 RepID=UPI001D110C33|nr:ArsA family ATPase [Dermatobacter hominis]UDY37255.1 ArsA family ATPase [Dermatobacter hominis]
MARTTLGLLDRKLLFVTGKGGVGKTSVASSIAMLAASRGKRTLVCEVDAKGNLADFLGVGPLRFEPTEVRKRLFAMSMDTEASLKEYMRLNLRLPLLAKMGPLARTFDFVANAAPGVNELLTVGKFTWEVRERNYDLVVVDASATGHVVGQLAAPVAINDLVKVGLVRSQTDWMIDILTDAETTGVVVVTVPEEMPVSETLELIERLQGETHIDVASVVVNRVLPELFGRSEEEIFDRLRKPDGVAVLEERVGEGVEPVLDGAELAVSLRRSRVPHLDRLRAGLPPGLPVLYLPFLFHRSHGVRATARIAEALGEELGF